MNLILNKYHAKEFLKGSEGSLLTQVRLRRDAIAHDLLIYDCDEKLLDSMVTFDDWQSSSFAKLTEWAVGNRRWSLCELLEAFRLLCLRTARLEREAAGIQITKFDYDLFTA